MGDRVFICLAQQDAVLKDMGETDFPKLSLVQHLRRN